MAFPEAWPVATSRGDFTAAAAWFCFSFDCFSLVCATATSDKHANPNTKILLFIFSLLCAGNGRHWLSRCERQTNYPHSDSEMLGACAGPRKLPRYWLAVWRGRPRPRKFHRCRRERPARALWEEHDFKACPERSRKVSNRLPLVIPRRLLTTAKSRWIMALTSPRLWALL